MNEREVCEKEVLACAYVRRTLANLRLISLPIPLPAPVTTTIFPVKDLGEKWSLNKFLMRL